MRGVALRKPISVGLISDRRCSSYHRTVFLCGCLQVRQTGESEKVFVDCVFQCEYERQRYCVGVCVCDCVQR